MGLQGVSATGGTPHTAVCPPVCGPGSAQGGTRVASVLLSAPAALQRLTAARLVFKPV